MRENVYQASLIKTIRERFPGCMVLKNDSGYLQGIPDLTILWKNRWATLEVKADEDSEHQPNQEHYVLRMNDMSFSAFIHPGNEEEILNAMEQALEG